MASRIPDSGGDWLVVADAVARLLP
jgi:hypothetical protein